MAEKKAPRVIAKEMGKTEDAVLRKIKRLGLEVVAAESCKNPATTSRLSLPKDLLSVEEALRMLAGALQAASKPGLDKVEVQRLQVVATIGRTYKNFLADYLDYRGVEADLIESFNSLYWDFLHESSPMTFTRNLPVFSES